MCCRRWAAHTGIRIRLGRWRWFLEHKAILKSRWNCMKVQIRIGDPHQFESYDHQRRQSNTPYATRQKCICHNFLSIDTVSVHLVPGFSNVFKSCGEILTQLHWIMEVTWWWWWGRLISFTLWLLKDQLIHWAHVFSNGVQTQHVCVLQDAIAEGLGDSLRDAFPTFKKGLSDLQQSMEMLFQLEIDFECCHVLNFD